MKCEAIEDWKGRYFISVEMNNKQNTSSDLHISELIGLILEKYTKLAMSNSGIVQGNFGCFF